MEQIRRYKLGKLTTGDVRKLNNSVICLMVMVAIFSIVWSIALQMLSGDFHDGIISAKLIFRSRDFTTINNKTMEIFDQDLQRILYHSYGVESQKTIEDSSDSQTEKPKIPKIPHVYELKTNAPIPAHLLAPDRRTEKPIPISTSPKTMLNRDADSNFLRTMSIDERATHWSHSFSTQFVYTFPVISEIVAIIWTAMCMIFQTGTKKPWGLPKPWRIVVPSIVMFTVMVFGSIAYTILTNSLIKRFCSDLRVNLSDLSGISCGDAIALLRPIIREHHVSHDTHLLLFRLSYTLSMVFWILALLVMILRYIFAVDFQLVDIDNVFERKFSEAQHVQPVYTEVLQQSPQHQAKPRPRSEDDFQSAKSRLSDVGSPLMDQQNV